MRYTNGRSRDMYGALGWGETSTNFLNFMRAPGPGYSINQVIFLLSE